METDWSKVLEVFGSGIIGVYLVMFLLMILTQLSNWLIGRLEQINKSSETEQA
jgi:hypothetical protein